MSSDKPPTEPSINAAEPATGAGRTSGISSPIPPDVQIQMLLLARVDGLEKELSEIKTKDPANKSFIDHISQLSTLITGGAIAAVGAIATIYYNYNQDQVRQLEAIDKFRVYLVGEKTAEDRRFGYYALTRLGQEQLAIDIITLKRDAAGEDLLTSIVASNKDQSVREAAKRGLAVLQSSRPGCEATYTIADDETSFVKFLNGWETTNIVQVEIPQLTKISKPVTSGKVRFNARAAPALRAAWADVEKAGLLDRVMSWDGAYVPRTLRGSNNLSVHACGLAFDINALANPTGAAPTPIGQAGSVLELVPIFEKHGFRWGGNFKPRADYIHFEYHVMDVPIFATK